MESLDIVLTLVRGPGNLASFLLFSYLALAEIETALPEIKTVLRIMETARPEIETALPKIKTTLPEIEIMSCELENKYQPQEGLIFELLPSTYLGRIIITRKDVS